MSLIELSNKGTSAPGDFPAAALPQTLLHDGEPGTTHDRLTEVGRLVRKLGHDLNNTLAPGLIASGLLKGDVQSPEMVELLRVIESSARRSSEIAETILMLGRGLETNLEALASPPPRLLPRPATRGAAEGQGERILFVDDEASIREMGRQAFENYGYQVLTASGSEAMALFAARHREIDLVFADLSTRAADGAALIRAMRRLAPSIPVVISTGNDASAKAADLEALQISRILEKPYSLGALLTAVREVRNSHPRSMA